ncbi:MAG: motif domain protein [Deltaproteobacteria bacterium]|nr:motif domain protein [Deltaproteobacteria bacterium]
MARLKRSRFFSIRMSLKKNRTPSDDFQGISSEQMHRLLHFPFSSPDLITFSPNLTKTIKAPVMHLFNLLLTAIGEKGLKTTATGNLPVKFMRQAADEYFTEENKLPFEIRTETDFFDLHITRLVCGLAGLIRKYRGRFIMTTRLRKLLAEGGTAAVYTELFHTFLKEYNWAFRDGYPAFPIIQQSFAFSLYLFHRFGSEWNPPNFYTDCFIKAFPAILNEAASQLTYTAPENIVGSCYSLRCLEGFAVFFGLMDIEYEGTDTIDRKFKLKKTALLDEVVNFHF